MGPHNNADMTVSELLDTHAANINRLVAELNDPEVSTDAGPLLPTPYRVVYDSLWCLRFLLSHPGDFSGALEAARKTLAWRRNNAGILEAAFNKTPPPLPASIGRYLVASVHQGTKNGDPLYIVRTGLSNTPALMKEVAPEELLLWLMYQREKVFLECDRTTRKTGRISRMITVNDMNHLSLSMIEPRFMTVLKASTKQSEVMYPQMLSTSVIINMPPVIRAVSRGLMSVVPARARAKVRVCPGSTLTGDISTCPFARKLLETSHVPTFLGGQCTCHALGGCICAVPNDQHEANLKAGKDGMCHTVVGARHEHEVFLQATPGCRVAYSYEVERGTLNGHGSLTFSITLRPDNLADPPAVEVVDLTAATPDAANVDNSAAHTLGGGGGACQEVVLLAPTKTRSDAGRVCGEVEVPRAGMVVVCWSNKGAAIMGRGLKCSVELLPPLAKEAEGVDSDPAAIHVEAQ